MPDVEAMVQWLQGLPIWGIYAALWATTYIENLFPPAPSDVIMLFIATLVGIGTVGLVPAISVATIGSVSGFLTAFWIGRRYGRRLLESDRLPFFNPASLKRVDGWFARWGYWVIVVNRFLAGTRAVISFFAGMSRMDIGRTTLLCTVSSLAWNGLIIWLGSLLGKNWRVGMEYLTRYAQVVTLVLIAAILFVVIRWFMRRRKARLSTGTPPDNNE